MAKMFYSIEETAEKLGVDTDHVKAMAAEGKLQQFRDRDRLVFKRDQVDQLAASAAGGAADTGTIGLSGSQIPLVDTGGTGTLGDSDVLEDTDAIDLLTDSAAASGSRAPATDDTATGTASGISVFDAEEVELADPMAQTQVSGVGEESDLSLESIGSGSGLLDLTHESDDTSLGAELIDEIMPGGTGVGEAQADVPSGTGILEGMASEAGAGPEAQAAAGALIGVAAEAYDPQGSAFAAGVLLGAMLSLIVALIVAVSGLIGVPLALTEVMASSSATVMMYAGLFLIISLALGGLGWVIASKSTR